MTILSEIARRGGGETMVERYQFTNGWRMEREPDWPFYWVLRNENARQIDRDQYRHDLMPRHGLTVDRYDGPDNAATFVDDTPTPQEPPHAG